MSRMTIIVIGLIIEIPIFFLFTEFILPKLGIAETKGQFLRLIVFGYGFLGVAWATDIYLARSPLGHFGSLLSLPLEWFLMDKLLTYFGFADDEDKDDLEAEA